MDNRRRNIVTRAIIFAGVSVIMNENRRSVWVKKHRRRYGRTPLIQELRQNEFMEHLRTDSESFHILLNKIRPKISKQDTVMRESISAEARLAATIQYLATGHSFEQIKHATGISVPSLSKIIPETCRAIYENLRRDYLKMPCTKQEWKKVAQEFQDKWQFINCGGAMDGKHVRIVPLPDSGATYYNYKHFYSIVLLALVGPNYEFLYVDVGKNGMMSDGGVLEYTDFYHKLKSGALNLPENDETVNNYNFVFLGDEAFGLEPNILKPYAQIELDCERKIYNYRLSNARNVVENTFGIISARFLVLHTAINIKNHANICYVVLAICALHNFLCKNSSSYLASNVTDREDVNTVSVQQAELHENSVPLVNLQRRYNAQMTLEAKQNRENYKIYYNTDGKV